MPAAAAILAVGHGLGDATPQLTSLVAQVGETLLADIGDWTVRRLSPLAGERAGADRAAIKRHVGELCDADVDVRACRADRAIVVASLDGLHDDSDWLDGEPLPKKAACPGLDCL